VLLALVSFELHTPLHGLNEDLAGSRAGDLVTAACSGHPQSIHLEAQNLLHLPHCPACWLSHAGMGEAAPGLTAMVPPAPSRRPTVDAGLPCPASSSRLPASRAPPSS
jgi:hypothetical protein